MLALIAVVSSGIIVVSVSSQVESEIQDFNTQDGNHIQTRFDSAKNISAYHVYMDMLKTIKKDKPKAYHHLMADLY